MEESRFTPDGTDRIDVPVWVCVDYGSSVRDHPALRAFAEARSSASTAFGRHHPRLCDSVFACNRAWECFDELRRLGPITQRIAQFADAVVQNLFEIDEGVFRPEPLPAVLRE